MRHVYPRDFNATDTEALEQDPERWPQQASNFNLLPVNISEKHGACEFICTRQQLPRTRLA